MSPVLDGQLPHPRTLLGAARVSLQSMNDDGPEGRHLKAYAAYRLGYHHEARRLWERLANDDDADALYQLGCMAELGLGEPCDVLRSRSLFMRAAELGHASAMNRMQTQRSQISALMAAYHEAP